MLERSVLVTLTGPTASGKSHLLNYIRDAGFSCLVSTTTRKPRPGEREGVDYYFISDDESQTLEAENKFAELAVYNDVRYGVTWDELKAKLSTGLTFLIVEPTGISEHVEAAIKLGAYHVAIFINAEPKTRIERLKLRLLDEVKQSHKTQDAASILKFFDRVILAFTDELKWINQYAWDLTLSGVTRPEENLQVIIDLVNKKCENDN